MNAAIPHHALAFSCQQLFLERKDLEGSADHLRKATKDYPQYTDAYVLLGMVYIEGGKLEDARGVLEKAAASDPNSANAQITLGMLLNHEKDYASAEKSLTRGLELDPQAPQGQYELAKTLWALGRWQDAEPHVQKALELRSDMAPAHVLMGNIALRKRSPELALKEFKEYLRLDPKGPMAAGVHQMVEKLEQSASTAH